MNYLNNNIDKRARGKLVSDYIEMEKYSEELQDQYIDTIIEEADEYNSFNMFLGNWNRLDRIFFIDIYHKRKIKLKRGYLYGLSNNLFLYSASFRTLAGLDNIEVDLN